MPHEIQTNVPLAPLTTLGVGGSAEYFYDATSRAGLTDSLRWAAEKGLPVTILGGGSNVLVHDGGVQGLVIKIALRGIEYTHIGDTHVVTAGAGESFDNLISELTARGISGFENLSGIPGTVGATPVQNVGAYGVEVKDYILGVEVCDRDTGAITTLRKEDCEFGYRSSLFKSETGKRYIILAVTYVFPAAGKSKLEYKDIKDFFGDRKNPTPHEIRNAILEIRKGKFPDWNIVGTAGSFFKNPIISKAAYEDLLSTYPELPGYVETDGSVKIALGYVLDKVLGLKGFREGNVGLYERQALVLVFYGKNATEEKRDTGANDVMQFATDITTRVKAATGIDIEWEVNVLK